MSGLFAAVQFLTRVPVKLQREPSLTRAVAWFGVVGAVIGAAVGGAAAGLWHLVPPIVAAAVAVLAGVLITGAFHEDGLADTADAFAGGWTTEDRLRILKDPLHGSYGVAALCGSIVLRIAAVAALASNGPAVVFASLVAADALGRCAALGAMAVVPVAVANGLGADYVRSAGTKRCVAGIVAGSVIAAGATGWWAAPFMAAAIAGTFAIVWLSVRKIGGITGDVLGAIEQVAECLVLVVATGLATRYALWWA